MPGPAHSFCLAGTQSGSGKTTLTLGLMAALRERGMSVQPFKCGPDYIDTGHHRHAAGRRSRNLDSWMMPSEAIRASFQRVSESADVAVCEGVMGLFDGASATTLSGSTAEIALLTAMPIILVVNAKAMARSLAALVSGFVHFEPRLRICGIIANQVGSERHASILRDSLAAAKLPPLLGALPRDAAFEMPERHLGLISDTEADATTERLSKLSAAVAHHVNIPKLLELTACDSLAAETDNNQHEPYSDSVTSKAPLPLRLGLARDAAFHFYYEDNLDALRQRGVEIIEFSPINDATLPDGLDGLYIGGGFPEQFSRELASNTSMVTCLHNFAYSGRSIFAECGGYMYLCREIILPDGARWPMANLLSATCTMGQKRRRLGYTEATSRSDGLFGPAGTKLRGHCFHWSQVETDEGQEPLFDLNNARGGHQGATGLRTHNVYASYFHPHFASNPTALDAWVNTLRSAPNRR